MKVLNKIKSIYLLAIVAILSFCMLLFPAMPKTANAEGTMGTGKIDIKSAKVVVQTYKGQDGNNYDKWAIMFKAKISQADYNAITDDGAANVKFGMLIGPTKFLKDATDYEGLITNKFVPISYVGSVAGGNVQELEFVDGKAEYWGAIVYDELKLADEKGPAAMDLTAIPFYADGTVATKDLTNETATVNYTAEDGFVGAKSATPRNILVESYLLQQDGAVVIDGVPIKESTIGTFAGEIEFFDGDAYICRSTNRLMVGEKQGELAPRSFNVSNVEFAIGGVARSATGEYEVYNAEIETEADKLENLPKYGKVNVVGYTPEGIGVYKAQVAERVIMRFADTKVGTTATDTTEDYLAQVSGSSYKSIFYSNISSKLYADNNDNPTLNNLLGGTGAVSSINTKVMAFAPQGAHDGLFVLGNSIEIPSSHNYTVISSYNGGMNSWLGTTEANYKKDKDQTFQSVGFMGAANAGFNGVFDGRGFAIDVNKKATDGIFPPALGATIKNTAFLNLASSGAQGGLLSAAERTTFENIYATVPSVNTNTPDANNGILMNMSRCTLNNFVVEVSAITDTRMNLALVYLQPRGGNNYGLLDGTDNAGKTGNSGFMRGRTTAGVFNFRYMPEAYYDEDDAKMRVCDNVGTSGNAWKNNISLEDVKKYFPYLFTANGTLYFDYWGKGSNNITNNAVENDVFAGTTGNNVYAVGTSPLYLNYQVKESGNAILMEETARATVFVNQTLQYNKVVVNEESGLEETILTDARTNPKEAAEWHVLSEFVENDLFKFVTEEGTQKWSLGEIILKGKQYRHGEARIARLLGESNPEDVLEVRLVNMQGWYDVANAQEMASYVLAQETPFDAEFWNVTVDGIVSWKNLPQA